MVTEALPAQRGGAKALLLTVLGEFVLPAGGSAWTSSLVTAAGALGIGEKNARQALARIRDQGLIEAVRHGRTVRWELTGDGRRLLESGAQRIYEFGTTVGGWKGEWLVAHCPVAESQRALRNQLRTQLGFLGFGELSASLLISPHTDREAELRRVLGELGLTGESIVFRSTTATRDESIEVAERAWDLDELSEAYVAFCRGQGSDPTGASEATFRALVELVHAWRRFPFVDPELPDELLPSRWAGRDAVEVFHRRHQAWSPAAQQWFSRLESDRSVAP
jgi:phenylacetic acid degradation operon negative regulatory protein